MTSALLMPEVSHSLWRIVAARGETVTVVSRRPLHVSFKALDGTQVVAGLCTIEDVRKAEDGVYHYTLMPTASAAT